ncbi:MAG: beta-ketoacyl-[acyl-carrier-protein] synthase family protein [Deltaproteobacteria bacterium]|nr:beta-ketoacyl-[acyl-carrier-protein] synthase family protein [Deltaproteobacteria bacterium]
MRGEPTAGGGDVVVTGLGTVNALASSVDAFAAALRAGTCAIGPVTGFDASGYRSRIAAEVKGLAAPDWLPPALRRRASRSDLFALVAAAEALRESGLDVAGAPARVGVVLGATTAGMMAAETSLHARIAGTARRYRRSRLVGTPIATSADLLAHVFGLGGPRLVLSTACSSSGTALGVARDWIRLGRADVVLAGGTESMCRTIFAGFNALKALSLEPCRPFDRRRAGLSLGEGAAILVVESAAHAARRNARAHATILGYGMSADAHHLTAPHPEGTGAALAMERALARAGIAAEEVGYINAHGTGTPLNDVVEAAAIARVFGEAADRVAVSSTKAAVGHTLGAAGAIEGLTSVLALRDGFLPPTVNLDEPDPACRLDFVPRASRPAALRYALSNSYGFGGNNTTVVFGRA